MRGTLSSSIHPDEPLAIIPAAGKGTRLLPFRCAKELATIGYDPIAGSEGGLRPRLVIQYAIDGVAAAGVKQAFVVISDSKFEIMRVLSDGSEFGVSLAYLHQRDVTGLPAAIDCVFPWSYCRISLLALPDTIVAPVDASRAILADLHGGAADVVLGVFPTDHPEDLCPVVFDGEGCVSALLDKQPGVEICNTWGLVAWRPSFAVFLHEFLQEKNPQRQMEMPLAEVACRSAPGTSVRAAIGTSAGARRWLRPDGLWSYPLSGVTAGQSKVRCSCSHPGVDGGGGSTLVRARGAACGRGSDAGDGGMEGCATAGSACRVARRAGYHMVAKFGNQA